MNRYFFLFFISLFATLISKAVQFGHGAEFESTEFLQYEEVDELAISSNFDGYAWLENKMTSKSVDLSKIYQEKAFTKKLTNNSEIRRIQKSYTTWIEEKVCNESPYIDKPVKANMTSRYGHREHPLSGQQHIHAGIDFRGSTGTPVLAGSAGVVKTARHKGNYGKTIILEHGNSYTTLYGHLSNYAVKEGDWVNMGQTIGYIGRTGRTTGPHLHFEVRCHNVPLNPMKYLGKMGQVAEVRFTRHVPGNFFHKRQPAVVKAEPAPVKHDPNYYTRMINLQKLQKLEATKKF